MSKVTITINNQVQIDKENLSIYLQKAIKQMLTFPNPKAFGQHVQKGVPTTLKYWQETTDSIYIPRGCILIIKNLHYDKT